MVKLTIEVTKECDFFVVQVSKIIEHGYFNTCLDKMRNDALTVDDLLKILDDPNVTIYHKYLLPQTIELEVDPDDKYIIVARAIDCSLALSDIRVTNLPVKYTTNFIYPYDVIIRFIGSPYTNQDAYKVLEKCRKQPAYSEVLKHFKEKGYKGTEEYLEYKYSGKTPVNITLVLILLIILGIVIYFNLDKLTNLVEKIVKGLVTFVEKSSPVVTIGLTFLIVIAVIVIAIIMVISYVRR